MNCFQKRREALASLLSSDDTVFIISAAPYSLRNGDVNYSYRQCSNFYYFTGFDESNAILLVKKQRRKVYATIFCQSINPSYDKWHGSVLGPKLAKAKLKIDKSYSIDDFDKVLPNYLDKNDNIFCVNPGENNLKERLLKAIHKTNVSDKIHDATNAINELRLFKDETEVTMLRNAAKVSCDAHLHAMRHTKPKLRESHVEGMLISKFMRHGCRQVAYESIVAGGKNACTLHYTKNSNHLVDGELLLVDAGAEFENYASDITRTYPINGKFSKEQRAIYEVVLDTQLKLIDAAKIGVEWKQLQYLSEIEITKGLVRLGILTGSPKKLVSFGAHKQFYMHGFGHWLGLDVHDVGSYKNKDGSSRMLEPGMVFTVEPGIYIDASAKVAAKWKNIGIRIEDDIVITNQGTEVLTESLPKSVLDIENIVGSAYA
ncbi:MAG: M24 family metallopeptidase [Legionellales bacterium]|jgi:Xaa-Pro aminopeptidase|nr:M24 family metallopeptidase [Legionellales bacterium]